jgi:glycerate kinase
VADVYLDDHGVDVRALEGAGAAGGLAGGLAAAGGHLVGGFDAVADELGLPDELEGADLVVTAEGFLDEQSFDGKVVGGVAELAAAAGVRCLAIVGEVLPDLPAELLGRLEVVSLVERFGRDRAEGDPLACIEEVTAGVLADAAAAPPGGPGSTRMRP